MPTNALARAYLASRPQAAARVLEQAGPAAAAELLAQLDAARGAEVLSCMLPDSAANCLAQLDGRAAGELLAALSTRPVLGILHALAPARRAALLAEVPKAQRAHLAMLLDYPAGSIGELMDPPRGILAQDLRVGEAIAHLARLAAPHPFEIFVVDAAKRPVGSLRPGALFGAGERERIGRLLTPVEVALPVRAAASAVRDHPAWTRHPALPVVDHHEALAGVLSHHAVCSTDHAPARATGDPDAVANALAAAGAFWSALADVTTRTLAPARETAAPPEEANND